MKLISDETIRTAETILERGCVCNSCLGRQFGQISTGMTNRERGIALRKAMGKPTDEADECRCAVCNGFFQSTEDYAKKAIDSLKGLEFRSFVVGTIMSSGLIEREESLWEDVGIEYCEPFKAESNRELGKIIERRMKKEVDEKRPDVNVILDLEKDAIRLQINPIMVSGKYRKLVRGIPQTKWDKYKETVEDLIARPFMKYSRGSGHSMHAAGREDIDARCLDWRPFVLEIKGPIKRSPDLKEMQRAVNKVKKVMVTGLRFSDKEEIVRIKSMRSDKTYRAIAVFENPLESGDLEKIMGITGKIRQKTPRRVLHRRADKTRIRKVKEISCRRINNKKLEIVIKGEAGLYIKELVTGDSGRTRPSVSEILDNPAKVEELDVIKIHIGKE
jgi:tRNA pseudouridine synthase 10